MIIHARFSADFGTEIVFTASSQYLPTHFRCGLPWSLRDSAQACFGLDSLVINFCVSLGTAPNTHDPAKGSDLRSRQHWSHFFVSPKILMSCTHWNKHSCDLRRTYGHSHTGTFFSSVFGVCGRTGSAQGEPRVHPSNPSVSVFD